MTIDIAPVEFWKGWSNVTEVEAKAIEKLELAREKIVEAMPAGTLVAIYVKGSFARREMKPTSDIDVVPIVTKTEFESLAFDVNSDELSPTMIVPLSIEEFERNKLMTPTKKPVDLRAWPDRLLRMLGHCRLIWGESVDPKIYPMRDDATAWRDEKEVIIKGYIPMWEEKRVSFDPLLKEFFWMKEMELATKGVVADHTFKAIVAGFEGKDDLVKMAGELRDKERVSFEEEVSFVQKLKESILN